MKEKITVDLDSLRAAHQWAKKHNATHAHTIGLAIEILKGQAKEIAYLRKTLQTTQ